MSLRRAAESLRRAARGILVLHPLPSALVAAAAAALAAVAGAPASEIILLALGMLGFQVSIGALNDLVDVERDRLDRSDKPIPAGIVSRRSAAVAAVAGASLGLAVSAWFGPTVLAVGIIGLGCGYAYDLAARRTGLGWIAFAVALPALLVWTWLAAAGTLPPGWEVLLPLAALAGPAVHLANSMADVDADRRSGAASLATRLGPRRSRIALVAISAVIWILAALGLLLLGTVSPAAWLTLSAAMVLAATGVLLSTWQRTATSAAGWMLGALALAVLAVAWVASVGDF